VKLWQYIVLCGLAIAGIVYIYLHRQEFGLTGPHTFTTGDSTISEPSSSPSVPAQITWETVNRAGDGFKVEMPVDSRLIQVLDYNEAGGTEQVNMLIAYPTPEISFSVAWADNPPVYRINGRSPIRTLDMARDDALARTQTSLVSESREPEDGSPTRSFVARNGGGGMMDSRLIFAGERLYMLTAAFPSSSARRERDVARFFDSFKADLTVRTQERLPSATHLRRN
jgi:hypothetical protein